MGRGWPSIRRKGKVCFGVWSPVSLPGVDGVGSLITMLARLRFNVDLAPFAGVSFSFGVSGTGAASSRTRALVDRRGSDMLNDASVSY